MTDPLSSSAMEFTDQPDWSALDMAVAWLSDLNRWGQSTYGLRRLTGSSEYDVVLHHDGITQPLLPLLKAHSDISSWLSATSWSLSGWGDAVQDAAALVLTTGQASPRRSTGFIDLLQRRPISLSWNASPELQEAYWSRVVHEPPSGRPHDSWASQLHALLSSPWSAAAEEDVSKIIRRVWAKMPDWQDRSGQSFRAWSHNDPLWSKPLDVWGCSYREKQDGLPLVCWALSKGWLGGLEGWSAETGLSFAFAPSGAAIPKDWWPEGDAPSAPLWLWACRQAPLHVVEHMLNDEPSLLSVCDQDGRTALHWAAGAGRENIVNFLCSQGADPSAEDRTGFIAAELIPSGHDNLFEMLERIRLQPIAPSPPTSSECRVTS